MGKFFIAWLLGNSIGSLVYSLILGNEIGASPSFVLSWEFYLYFFLIFTTISLALTFVPLLLLFVFIDSSKQSWIKFIGVNVAILLLALFLYLVAIIYLEELSFGAILLTLSYSIPYFLVFNFALWVALPAQLKK